MAKFVVIINLLLFTATACAAAQPLTPKLAQQILVEAWQANQHAVWELDWPAAPVAGPITVETWRAGHRYRFEILESPAPALIGETLAVDGQTAWRYNRFNPPEFVASTAPVLSPVSDAFMLLDARLKHAPHYASREQAQINFSPAKKFSMSYPNGDRLILWQDEQTGLPMRIEFSFNQQTIILNARRIEPLLHPPDELFGVGDWVY